MSNIFENKGALAATIVVAASNSLNRGAANYVCDGVADDVEIQAAINALPAAGGRVVLSEGSYSIGASISIERENVSLVGINRQATVLTLANGINAALIGVGVTQSRHRTEIAYMTLRGNSANNANDLARGIIASMQLGDIHDIDIEDFYGTGMVLQGAGGFYTLGCFFHHIHIVGAYNPVESPNGGININQDVFDNFFHHITIGRYCYGVISTGATANNIFDNCFLDMQGSYAYYLENPYRFKIRGGYITNWGRLSNGLAVWIFSSGVTSPSDIQVQGVGMNSGGQPNAWGGIGLEPAGGTTISVVDISGNIVRGPVLVSGIYFGTTGSLSRVKVHDNIIVGCANPIHPDTVPGVLMHKSYSDLFMDVLAVSATHVVNAQTLAADPTVCALAAQPDVPRTLSYTITHPTLTAFTLTFVGVNAKGQVVIEVLTQATGWTGETGNAFATVTSITMSAMTGNTVADTIDVGITDVLGLSNKVYETGDVYKIKKNNANALVAVAQVNVTYDTYDMVVIGLAVGDDFTVYFKSNLNVIA